MSINLAEGSQKEEGSFKALRVTYYKTQEDQAQKINGTIRYVMTEKETRDKPSRASLITSEEVEVRLQAGCFRITTPEGNSGIEVKRGIIGLAQALQTGQAFVAGYNRAPEILSLDNPVQ